jgi:hypothetical protein
MKESGMVPFYQPMKMGKLEPGKNYEKQAYIKLGGKREWGRIIIRPCPLLK